MIFDTGILGDNPRPASMVERLVLIAHSKLAGFRQDMPVNLRLKLAAGERATNLLCQHINLDLKAPS